jgi:hypothetical protein
MTPAGLVTVPTPVPAALWLGLAVWILLSAAFVLGWMVRGRLRE